MKMCLCWAQSFDHVFSSGLKFWCKSSWNKDSIDMC